MKKFFPWSKLALFFSIILMGFYILPGDLQKTIFPWTPDSITKADLRLGLDLQGGSQLEYKIDLRKVPENDRQQIVEGVKEVIEKRVNGLGLAEPNIYLADVGGEKHIIVELANDATISKKDILQYLGIEKNPEQLNEDERKKVSLEKAKDTVGKTILLEFKEQRTQIDPNEITQIRANAEQALNRIKNGENFAVIGQEEKQAYPGKVEFNTIDFTFESELTPQVKEILQNLKNDQTNNALVETIGSFKINEEGQAVENKTLSMFRLKETREQVKNKKEVTAAHILIKKEGRKEKEARELAEKLQKQAVAGDDFAVLAQQHSNDTTTKDQGGRLEKVITGNGNYLFDVEEAAMKLKKKGEISPVIKTAEGFEILKALDIKENVKEKQYKYETIAYSLTPDPWQETGLNGQYFVRADMQLDQTYRPYVSIQFNQEGAKMFEEITARNVNKPVAIFVGGELISAPIVNEKISGGQAQISGRFTVEEAKNLARDLNTGAIPAPIVLTGEYTIGATLGKTALNQSINAGLIGLLIVMLFMGIIYRISGLMANIALLVYATILLFLLKSSFSVWIAIFLSITVLAFLMNKIINNKDSGWEKFLAFLLSFAGFFFLLNLLQNGVVLTVAGIAGIILSIGMAVDANILIFERFKEEVRNGKNFKIALQDGFERAWSAIRDSNFSTLITCAILFYFGSSIIKGFAFNLAAGVLVSMFTAITITKTLLESFIGKKIAENFQAFGANPNAKDFNFDYIGRTKTWFIASGGMALLSLIIIGIFGLKTGIDFSGGTLTEIKFEQKIDKTQIVKALAETEEEMNNSNNTITINTPKPSSPETPTYESQENNKLELKNSQILESDENSFIIKGKYINSETHDLVMEKMREKLPNFEELRFTTIGPIIGQNMLKNALIAILVAMGMIIIYVAIAFRSVPKEVGAWRFGTVAIITLLHDVLIVIGIFAILGQVLNVEIDSLFITAMLTVFGYSVNDTIIIFDRLREHMVKNQKDLDMTKIANKAMNETILRSCYTSLSTIVTLLAILIFGSNSIFYFILALTLGIALGTYSSIFVSTPLLVFWYNRIAKK